MGVSTLALFAAVLTAPHAQDAKPQTIAQKVVGMDHMVGLFDTYADSKAAKMYMRLPAPDSKGGVGSFLYVETLATGIGSNDLGIDRSQIGQTQVINLTKVGGKIMFETPNLAYRALTDNADERGATEQGFPFSIIFSATPVATDSDGSTLIDITDFLVRDSHGVGRAVGFSLDRDRSMLLIDQCKSFPLNLEFETMLTFAGQARGQLAQHIPDPSTFTLIDRHSFVKLPDEQFKPRRWDPRAGVFNETFMDFASPVGSPLWTMYADRHRLIPQDPGSTKSKPVEPIVYYVDRAIPQPIRQALIDGGNYWKRAFDAAGFEDAFRVEELPQGIDPLDVRYNVVMWMNRSTRGYAYGQSVSDPRTGEIIKGAVNLDSQRIRQDVLVLESILGAKNTGSGNPNDPIQIALGRIRQLAAHEIGHTLGFTHNFAGSTNGRSTVMDYAAPFIKVDDKGELDFSDAYAKSVGDWDVQAVRWNYTYFATPEAEKAGLAAIMKENFDRGLRYLPDVDADDQGGGNPMATRWDNGNNPVEGLRRAIKIRDIGLARFGLENIKAGRSRAELELVFAPLYYWHRYDIEATAKLLGGVEYEHSIVGDGAPPSKAIAGPIQWDALNALIGCVVPSRLEIPSRISSLLGTWPQGLPQGERFPSNTNYAFDSFAAADSISDLVFSRILNPQRLQRIVEYSARDTSIPNLDKVLDKLVRAVLVAPSGTPMQVELQEETQRTLLMRLMSVANDELGSISSAVEARLRKAIGMFTVPRADGGKGLPPAIYEHFMALANQANTFLNRPMDKARHYAPPPPATPGAPIGMGECWQPSGNRP